MKTLINLDNAFKSLKIITIVVIVMSFGFCFGMYFIFESNNQKAREKIYVLTSSGALELAQAKDPHINRKAELQNHIDMFHRFFFEFDPDANEINKSVNRALVLIDDSGKQLHYSRKEALYYHKVIEGSISSRIQIDSIVSDLGSYPYLAKIYAKQKLIRPSKIAYKNLVAICQLRDVKRTDDNPHGLLIEQYRLINNSTMYEKDRN